MIYSLIPAEMRATIGEIIVQWGTIESIMFSDLMFYAIVRDVHEAGICMPIPNTSKKRVRLWKRAQKMAWDCTDFPLKNLDRKGIYQKVSDHLEKRNFIAHAMWIGDTKGDGSMLARGFDTKSKTFKETYFTQKYLDDICRDMAVTKHIIRDDAFSFFRFLPKMKEHLVPNLSLDDHLYSTHGSSPPSA